MNRRRALIQIVTGIPAPPELVAYWKMDELTGDAIDALGANDLTEAGTVGSASGIIDKARGPYTNSSTYFYWPTGSITSIFDASLFWAECWFKVSSTGGLRYIMGKGRIQSTGWSVYYNEASLMFDLANQKIGANGTAYADGDWHYCFVANRAGSGTNERRMYVDGSLFAQGAGVSFAKAPFALTIGVNGSLFNSAWPGYIDEMAYGTLSGTPYTWTELYDLQLARFNNGKGKRYVV